MTRRPSEDYRAFLSHLGDVRAQLVTEEFDLLATAAETRLLGGQIDDETEQATELLASLTANHRLARPTTDALTRELLAIPLALESDS